MDDSLTGRLLVAMPALEDPNFERAVVLVLDHDDDGALGVVLNKASEVTLSEALDQWAGLAARPAVVFGGGPVEPTAVVALGLAPAGGDTQLGAVQLVDLSEDPPTSELERVRVFAGYAGWAPDQLEAEIGQGAWIAVPALPEDVFTDDPGGLWQRVLDRQPGRLRMLATFPEDPSTN